MAYLLEGSVRKDGQQLRVETELVRGSTGELVWVKTFVRPYRDLIGIQDEIAGMVAGALTATLGPNTAVPPSGSYDAFEAYLKAMAQMRLDTTDGYLQATRLLEKAIRIDPKYAAAMCRIANVVHFQMNRGEISDAEGSRQAMKWAHRALEVDPNFAQAYLVIGNLAFDQSKFGSARENFRRALDLDPNLRPALANIAFLSEFAYGNFEHTLTLNREDAEADPRDVNLLRMLMWQYTIAGRYSDAMEISHRIQALSPNTPLLHALNSYVYLLSGRAQEAIAELSREADSQVRDAVMAQMYWASGQREQSDGAIVHLEKTQGGTDAYAIADAHAYRGEKDQAFEWLQRSVQGREPMLQFVRVDPFLASLRDDPRFQGVLAAVQLDDASR